jgi:arylsulfatase A-like enzyme
VSDVVPTLCGLLGMEAPAGSLGHPISGVFAVPVESRATTSGHSGKGFKGKKE